MSLGQKFVTLVVLQCVHFGTGYNVSPAPSYSFMPPSSDSVPKQTRSSHFGYSVTLRMSGVLVGAPRAETELLSVRRKGSPDTWMNETGTVYHCRFDGSPRCVSLDFESYVRNHSPAEYMKEITSVRRDYSMLGATVDGFGDDRDWVVACAPKSVGVREGQYRLNGFCYLANGTTATGGLQYVHKIKPLRLKQYQNTTSVERYYLFGQQGFSLHFAPDPPEVVMGAPGVADWAGTIIRYRQQAFSANPPTMDNTTFRQNSSKNPSLVHESVVPNPLRANVKRYSYFGYAVSSGRFRGAKTKPLYVASAPRANDLVGEVVIFDLTFAQQERETRINKHHTFAGRQMGEFFGYSLLTDDFNGDGFSDLAIGAPMHSRAMEYDNGAVYVWLNAAGVTFGLQVKLSSAYERSGRFGTCLGLIGDINRDGFADIAVGAPFEEDGVVYLFLGSEHGLQPKPSQRLVPPARSVPGASPQPMFGHAISRGLDVDGNGWNDLAIGAPNAETVYVYRTYPVVKVEARINATKRELPAEPSTFTVAVCWSVHFPAGRSLNVTLQYRFSVDRYLKRAIGYDGSTVKTVAPVGNGPVCQHYNVTINASPTTLLTPILIEVEYGIASSHLPPHKGPFCVHCYHLDHTTDVLVRQWIPFKTGCSNGTCVADLRVITLRWIDIASPYAIGSTKVATVEVEIENAGENAYHPQLNVTVASPVPVAKLPHDCEASSPSSEGRMTVVVCELNNRLPLRTFARVKRVFGFDMTHLEVGQNVTLSVEAISASEERDPSDNAATDELVLVEFSDVSIQSKSHPAIFNLDNDKGIVNVTHRVKVHNSGPSAFREFMLHVGIPLVYTAGQTRCEAVRLADVTVRSRHNDTALAIDWILKRDSSVIKQSSTFLGDDGSHGIDEAVPSTTDPERRKRSSEFQPSPVPHSSITTHSPPDERSSDRTVFFNCTPNNAHVECLQLQTRVRSVPPGKEPVFLEVRFKLDLAAIESCLREEEDVFLISILSEVRKQEDGRGPTFAVSSNQAHIEAYRIGTQPTPIWIFVLSSVGGLLVLLAMTYAMHRGGFFKRTMKEKLDQLQQASLTREDANAPAPED